MKRRPDSTATPFDRDVWRSEVGKWEGWGDLAPKTAITVEEARAQKYRTVEEYAAGGPMSYTRASQELLNGYRAGKLERIRVAGSRAYAYRPKEKGKP